MLERLFRGKRRDNDNWIIGYYLVVGGISYILPEGCFLQQIVEVDPSTVGQYTGSKDSAKNKIFEWDIVKDIRWGDTYQVNFSEKRGGYYPFAQGDGCGCCEQDVVDSDKVVVIGNVYDTPELLEKKEDKYEAD